ncbi:hypothetical protein C8R43DRAFT_75549 [Mycena crocata]|nr:hypothetical protein C8R43DRAFT_75549 [Mycena crocata]
MLLVIFRPGKPEPPRDALNGVAVHRRDCDGTRVQSRCDASSCQIWTLLFLRYPFSCLSESCRHLESVQSVYFLKLIVSPNKVPHIHHTRAAITMSDALSLEIVLNDSTLGVQEEMLTLSTVNHAGGLDINDANRKKIVIKPRCKDYVQKQRSIRTLASFSFQSKSVLDAGPDCCDTTPVTTLSTVVKASPTKTRALLSSGHIRRKVGARDTSTVSLLKALPTQPRAFGRPKKSSSQPPSALKAVSRDTMSITAPPTKPREQVVASGRIEKLPRSPPRKPDLPVDASSVVALAVAHYELYSCGCAVPEDCCRCTMRRLADQFCAIVTARKEKLRAEAMFS